MSCETDNEVLESESFQVEQSQESSETKVKSFNINSLEVAAVKSGPEVSRVETSFVTGVEALNMQSASEELDIRPYVFDSNSGQHLLWDSGSQVTAWPPEPGDRVDIS